jgi:hypothetical protein
MGLGDDCVFCDPLTPLLPTQGLRCISNTISLVSYT